MGLVEAKRPAERLALPTDAETSGNARHAAAWSALGIVATAVVFFAAARWLPPVETGADSAAVFAGYTNWLAPLVAILLVGALAIGAIVFATARERVVALQLAMVARSPWGARNRHIAGAIVLAVLVIAHDPAWSGEAGYFGQRVEMMAEGLRPYRDFEYAYGALVAYLPFVLHSAGLNIHGSLVATLDVFVITGIVSFAIILQRVVADARARVVLFWLLVACELFVEPGPSLNYNFGRYALPFAVASLATETLPALGAAAIFTLFAAAAALLLFVAPDVSLSFCAGLPAWLGVVRLAVSQQEIPNSRFAAAGAGLGLALFGAWLALPEMFTTFIAYSQAQILLPVVPHPMMLLAVFGVLTVGAINFAVAL